MNDSCLKCGKGPVSWWKNEYINYYDFKCGACGYVWHDVNPGKGKPLANDHGKRKTAKKPAAGKKAPKRKK